MAEGAAALPRTPPAGKRLDEQSSWLHAALDVKATPHSLRHAFATTAASKTDDTRAVQQILGHRRLSTTATYTHPDLAAMTGVVAAIA